jgi:hypothetical protein
MSDASSIDPRFKRPDLERSEPRRGFAGVLGGAPQPPAADGVARGVDLGYRVIEDYLRQGQSFARGMFDPADARSVVQAAGDPQRLAERMLQYASDLAAVWFEYVRVVGGAPQKAAAPSAAVSGSAGPFDIEPPEPRAAEASQPSAPSGADAPPSPAAAARPVAVAPQPMAAGRAAADPQSTAAEPAGSTRIAIALLSKQRCEVVVDLKPGSAGLALSAHDLRARETGVPRICGVLITGEPERDMVRVDITVPDAQPPGVYHGIILDDASNLPRGTLSLRLIA